MQTDIDTIFLSPSGEQGWSRLSKHLRRANRFWLGAILTSDLQVERIFRSRAEAQCAYRSVDFRLFDTAVISDIGSFADSLIRDGVRAPGCNWVTGPSTSDANWMKSWTALLSGLNTKRDLIRSELGGLVVVAPQGVKRVAQQQANDLWSVLDLLVEVPIEPALPDIDRAIDFFAESSPNSGYRDVIGFRPPEFEIDASGLPENLISATQSIMGDSDDASVLERASEFESVIQTSSDLGLNDLAALLLLRLSDAASAITATDDAILYAERGIRLNPYSELQSALYSRLVDLYSNDLNVSRLKQVIDQLVRSRTSIANEKRSITAYRNLALTYSYVGEVFARRDQYGFAGFYSEQALKIFTDIANRLSRIDTNLDMARSLVTAGEHVLLAGEVGRAKRHFEDAAEVLNEGSRRNFEGYGYAMTRTLMNLGRVAEAEGNYSAALDYLDRARGAADEQFRQGSDAAPEVRRQMWMVLTDLGDVLVQIGDFQRALDNYQRALTIVETSIKSGRSLDDQSIILANIGSVYGRLGETDLSKEHYLQSLTTREKAVDSGGLSPQGAQLGISASLTSLGNITAQAGDYNEALEYYLSAYKILNQISNQSIEPSVQRMLTSLLGSIGVVYERFGEYELSLDYFFRSLRIAEQIQRQDAGPDAKRIVSVCLTNVGDAMSHLGAGRESVAFYQRALTIDLELVETLDSPEAIRDYTVSLLNMGDALNMLGETDESAELYSRALNSVESLIERVTLPEFEVDLAIILTRLGDVASEREDWTQAKSYFARAVSLLKDLAGRQHTVDIQIALPNAIIRLAQALRAAGESKQAQSLYKEALEVYRGLLSSSSREQVERHLSANGNNVGDFISELEAEVDSHNQSSDS